MRDVAQPRAFRAIQDLADSEFLYGFDHLSTDTTERHERHGGKPGKV
jgi:hypothetical protein